MTLIELARRMRPLIVKAAQSLPDEDAVSAPALYDEWIAGFQYVVGYKVRRGDNVFKAIQEHTSQTGWEPETAASQWTRIDEIHIGTFEDPIPYNGNMELVSGKYYIQNDIVYLCNRDSGSPVYHALDELVGLYVVAV